MFSKGISQPTDKSQALQDNHQCKHKTNNRNSTTEQKKRARTDESTRTKQISQQSSINNTSTETDSLPCPTTDHESTVDLTSNADHADDTDYINENNEIQGEASEAEFGGHSHASERD